MSDRTDRSDSFRTSGNATSSQSVPYLSKHQIVFPLQFIEENAKRSLDSYIILGYSILQV